MASHSKRQRDWQAEWKETAKEYRKLAKRANQRMVRLERYAQRGEYRSALEYSYSVAQKEIKALYGKQGDRLRYTETPRMVGVEGVTPNQEARANVERLKAQMKSIEKFLGSESSTIADIKDTATGEVKRGLASVYDKRAQSINDRLKRMYGFDADLSARDLQRFFDSRKQKKLQDTVGSDQMFIVAAVMRDKRLASNKRDLQKFFRDNIETNMPINEKDYKDAGEMFDKLSEFVEITGNEMLDSYVTQAIKAGLNYKNLFI